MTIRSLFTSKGKLRDQLAAQEQRATDAVKNVLPDTLLATPEPDLVNQFYEEFGVEPLRLHVDQAESLTGVAATRVDVSRDPSAMSTTGPAPLMSTAPDTSWPFPLRERRCSSSSSRATSRAALLVETSEGAT